MKFCQAILAGIAGLASLAASAATTVAVPNFDGVDGWNLKSEAIKGSIPNQFHEVVYWCVADGQPHNMRHALADLAANGFKITDGTMDDDEMWTDLDDKPSYPDRFVEIALKAPSTTCWNNDAQDALPYQFVFSFLAEAPQPAFPDGGLYTNEVSGIKWQWTAENANGVKRIILGDATGANLGKNLADPSVNFWKAARRYKVDASGDSTALMSSFEPAAAAATSVEIPETLGGWPVDMIGPAAFANYGKLASVTIPPSVVAIAAYAFENCTSLESVVIPASVKYIAANAFKGCSSLRFVEIEGEGVEVQSGCFSGCTKLQAVFFDGQPCTIHGYAQTSSGEPVTIINLLDFDINNTDGTNCATVCDFYFKAGAEGVGEELSGRPTRVWTEREQTWTDETTGLAWTYMPYGEGVMVFGAMGGKATRIPETIGGKPVVAVSTRSELKDVILPVTVGDVGDYGLAGTVIFEGDCPELNKDWGAKRIYCDVNNASFDDKGLSQYLVADKVPQTPVEWFSFYFPNEAATLSAPDRLKFLTQTNDATSKVLGGQTIPMSAYDNWVALTVPTNKSDVFRANIVGADRDGASGVLLTPFVSDANFADEAKNRVYSLLTKLDLSDADEPWVVYQDKGQLKAEEGVFVRLDGTSDKMRLFKVKVDLLDAE